MLDRRMFLSALPGIAAGLSGGQALAQGQPPKLTRIVIGFPVGGGVDNAVRPLTVKMGESYPAGLVIEAKPGGAGRLAAEFVSKNSVPDGTTMLATPDFSITLAPHIYRKLPFDPVKDFTPVGTLQQAPLVLWVGPMVPASVKTVPDFLAWAKARPNEAAFASSGSGGAPHFVGMMFSRASGVPLLHVPYKGGAPALQDTMAGTVACCVSTLGEVMPQLGTGRLRPLAVTGAKRSRFIPEVPTLVELGFKDIVVEPWIGILMPAGTPEPIVSRASRLLNEALREPSVRDVYARGGYEPLLTPADKFGEMVKADVARWGQIVAASGFTPEE